MSKLPQRKKSAEEIAQLRDGLGVPNQLAPAAKPKAKATEEPKSAALPEDATSAASKPGPAPASAPAKVRQVRSLRKSEQAPIEVKPPIRAKGSPLPAQRRSREELEEMKKRDALALLNAPQPNPKLLPASPIAIAPGYLFAIGGASCFVFEDFPWTATASCAGLALVVALLIFLKRPISKHHAGFIAMITLFVVVFGALHHFPHLQYAT